MVYIASDICMWQIVTVTVHLSDQHKEYVAMFTIGQRFHHLFITVQTIHYLLDTMTWHRHVRI